MNQSILILGRQPALGRAEAESLFGGDALHPVNDYAVVVDIAAQDVPFTRLGGSTRVGRVLTRLPYTDWFKIEEYLLAELPKHTCCLPEGKIRLGISTYGFSTSVRTINTTGLKLKKIVKNPPSGEGRSVRVVPNNDSELNTAQVIHNQLTGSTGMEMLLVRDGNDTILAQTTTVQDIEAYAARDQARPARDARVGMLPPKLAQIITNLAVSSIDPKLGVVVLDPFCGTGVVLQEATLMGYKVRGSDLEPRMIEYSEKNLRWLASQNWSPIASSEDDLFCQLDVGDATNFSWIPAPNFIAGETYLGRPFSAEPTTEILNDVMRDVDLIHRKFLKNVAQQTTIGFRMCIAIPAWKTKNGFKHLKVLDSLEELGYNRVSFVHTNTRDLIYHRDNQVVGRELVTLIRK